MHTISHFGYVRPRTFTIRLSARTLRDMKLSFLGELPLSVFHCLDIGGGGGGRGEGAPEMIVYLQLYKTTMHACA